MILEQFLRLMNRDIRQILSQRPILKPFESVPSQLKLETQEWAKVDRVSAAYVDMVDSANIDFEAHPETSATIYETFTGTLVETMRLFGANYADIQGDGVLAIFSEPSACGRAFLAVISFMTVCEECIEPLIKSKTEGKIRLRCRSGISTGPTIVKRVGSRGDWNNEVWAYRTINRTARLCGLAEPGRLVVDHVTHEILSQCNSASFSCGCQTNRENRRKIERTGGAKELLWGGVDYRKLAGTRIDEAWEFKSLWCPNHGAKYFDDVAQHFNLDLPKLRETVG